MPSKEYSGVIVMRPPPRRSFQGQPRTRAQELELTRRQTEVLMRQLPGKPIVQEHGSVPVGVITRAFYNANGDACVAFDLDERLGVVSQRVRNAIARGYLRGLSLSHGYPTGPDGAWELEQPEAREVSLVFQGARDGTWLTDWPDRSETNVAECKPSPTAPSQVRSFVCASARLNNTMAAPAPFQAQMQMAVPPQAIGQPAAGAPNPAPNTTVQVSGGPAGTTPRSMASVLGDILPGQKRRRVTLPDGRDVEMTEEELQHFQMQMQMQMQQQQQQQPLQNAPPPVAVNASKTENPMALFEKFGRGEALSEDERTALLESIALQQNTVQKLSQENAALAAISKESTKAMQMNSRAFLEALVPFVQAYLGPDSVSQDQQEQLRKEAESSQGMAAVMASIGPKVCSSAALAMELKKREDATLQNPRMQKALQMLSGMQPVPPRQPQAPMRQMPMQQQQQQFPSESVGWQRMAPPAGMVNASAGAGGGGDDMSDLESLTAPHRGTTNSFRLADVLQRASKTAGQTEGFSPAGLLPRMPQ